MANVHLKHAPGAMAVYCNDGFTLIERIVLAVTGQTYPAFVQSALLNPLGMARSGYTLQPLPPGTFASGSINDAPQGQEFVMGYATGGLCTTPGDMMKLAAMLIQGGEHDGQRIVSKTSVAEMGRIQNQGMHPGLTPTGSRAWAGTVRGTPAWMPRACSRGKRAAAPCFIPATSACCPRRAWRS